MKALPTDPYAFQARVFDAFCNDLFDMAAGHSRSCERTNTLREVSKQSVRPIRPRFIGPCKGCGDRYFGCECEIGDGV